MTNAPISRLISFSNSFPIKCLQPNSDDLDLSASTANLAQILTNVNIDNEQRHLQQQLQTNEDPLQKILPKVKFDCKDRKEGYYADPDFNCEVFHYCKSNGYRFTLVCPVKSRYSMVGCFFSFHFINPKTALLV